MKTLEQKEWVAVVVAVFIVGFFFIFGSGLLSVFSNGVNTASNTMIDENQKLLINDIIVGSGDTAIVSSKVTVHYTGHFVDGTVFDSSLDRESFQFVLGSGQVIEGWDNGVLGMKVGGKRILSIPPEMAYGPDDYGPIPGNSTLIFEVELLKVE